MEELPQREEEAAEEAANDVQDSGDMKEAGNMDEEEQEPKEDEGAEEEPTLALASGKLARTLALAAKGLLPPGRRSGAAKPLPEAAAFLED